MLKSALPKLQGDIEKILIDSLYEAQMSVFKANGSEPVIDTYCNTTLQESAMSYAKKAAEKASQPLAEAIYNFVMEIGILAVPKSLTAPNGPVSGVINMVDFKVS